MSLVFKELGVLVDFKGGGTPSRNVEEYWANSIPWATVKDLNEGITLTETQEFISELGLKNSASNLITKGTIIIPTRMALGKVVISEIDVAINQDLKAVFVKDKEKLDVKYLLRFLESYKENIASMGKGATVKGITLDQLKAIKVPLPPLAAQRRIASILDQADELRQKRQQAIEKLDQLLQATFIDMFGDPVDNLKALQTVALLDLCKKVTDGTHQSPKWTTEGIPFLFISHIVDGEIDYSSQKFIDQSTYDSLTKSTKIELNDILYTTVGSYGNVARVKSDQLFCFQRHIAHIKPNLDKVNPKFLEKMLSSNGIRRQADRLVRGVAQKTLNLKDLKEIIVFNIPLDKQNHFVQKCEVIESLKIKSKLALNQSDDLFKSLQNQAFSGNL